MNGYTFRGLGGGGEGGWGEAGSHFCKGSTLKGKNLLQANSFRLRVAPMNIYFLKSKRQFGKNYSSQETNRKSQIISLCQTGRKT